MAKKFKLAYVTGRFPSTSMVFQQNEILGLIAAGAAVRVLSCRPTTPQELGSVHDFAQPILKKVIYPNYGGAFKGIVLCLLKKPVILATNILYLLVALSNPFVFPKVFAAFLIAHGWYPILLKEKYDWIHADFGKGTATVALILSKLLNCQFSFKVHAWDIYYQKLDGLDPLKMIKGRQASLIFSVHEYGRRILAKSMGRYIDKIKVNYGSIRTDDFKKLTPALGSKRFVALGRLVQKKGFNVLVHAAVILKDRGEKFIVDIYGLGPEEQTLRRIIREKGLQKTVNLEGWYKNDDLPIILFDCLAVIVPSIMDKHGDMDGIPTVIYETMALGRAVIASRISGIPEVVYNGDNGYLVEPGDAIELAERMSEVLENPENSFAMGKEGRLLVQKNHDYILNAKAIFEAIDTFVPPRV